MVAVYGHREASDDRGSAIQAMRSFRRSLRRVMNAFDFDKEEDRAVWKVRQTDLNQKSSVCH